MTYAGNKHSYGWIDRRIFYTDRDYHDRVIKYLLRQALVGSIGSVILIEMLRHPVTTFRLFLEASKR